MDISPFLGMGKMKPLLNSLGRTPQASIRLNCTLRVSMYSSGKSLMRGIDIPEGPGQEVEGAEAMAALSSLKVTA